jgi:hypothetical protein
VEHAHPPDHPHPMMRLQARVDHHHLLITISDHGRWLIGPRVGQLRGTHRGPQRPPAGPATLRRLSLAREVGGLRGAGCKPLKLLSAGNMGLVLLQCPTGGEGSRSRVSAASSPSAPE